MMWRLSAIYQYCSDICVWHSGGNGLVVINEVELHQVWLVPGWVTVLRRVNHLV